MRFHDLVLWSCFNYIFQVLMHYGSTLEALESIMTFPCFLSSSWIKIRHNLQQGGWVATGHLSNFPTNTKSFTNQEDWFFVAGPSVNAIALSLTLALTLLVVISVMPCWHTTVTHSIDLDTMRSTLESFGLGRGNPQIFQM